MSYLIGALVGILNIYLLFTNIFALLVLWIIQAVILIYLEGKNHGNK